MVLCKTNSEIVSSLGACGGVVKLMLLISSLIGVLVKCTCLASLYLPRVKSPKVLSVVTAAPLFYLQLAVSSW